MKIVSRSKYDVAVSYRLEFDRIGSPGSGFSFECDERGNVDVSQLNPDALKNYQECLAGTNDTRREGVRKLEQGVRTPAIGECACGGHVELRGFTNTCRCGRDYNSAGQSLAPRQQWGEETGEHWTDIVRIP